MKDTSPDVARAQVELLRAATVARRVQLARSLSTTTRELAWWAIRRARPELSDQEVSLLFVAVHYGRDLADRLRAHLAARA